MYCDYFGFSERPFSIAPNPKYLYMSDRHREALAHLVFGVGESGGFVLLTGEVGTGKTTVSRCLLEQLPENTEIAFILNPKLTSLELLQSICDDLELSYEKYASLKQLNDVINTHLLEAHGRGVHTVLLIDEAQNLAPDVLEQIRLLTNLETNEQKLLQIILIGQPELKTLLARNELRQLSQRVTARYHLEPLAENELSGYLKYRVAVAGVDHKIFSTEAVIALHRLTKGIPRLINTVCDRALLGAYSKGLKQVNSKLIRQAAVEVIGKENIAQQKKIHSSRSSSKRNWFIHALVVIFFSAAGVLVGTRLQQSHPEAMNSTGSLPVPQSGSLSGTEGAKDIPPAIDTLQSYASDYEQALELLARNWSFENIHQCSQLNEVGLRCEQIEGNWKDLLAYNRPAILTLKVDHEIHYLVVENASQLDAKITTLKGKTIATKVFPKEQIEKLWQGNFGIIWKPPAGFSKSIAMGDSGIEVQWLEQRLLSILEPRLLHQSIIPATIKFDQAMSDQLKQFQKSRGLNQDGIAGMKTIMVINQLTDNSIPLLSVTRNNKESEIVGKMEVSTDVVNP